MLSLKDILDKKEEIKDILERHHVPFENCKIFGSLINQKFPVSAHAHFLITPGQNTDQQHWDNLVSEIKQLFIESYLKFYTPGYLDSYVKLGELDQKVVDKVMIEAKSLQDLFQSAEKENEKKKGPEELSTNFSLPVNASIQQNDKKNNNTVDQPGRNGFFKTNDSNTKEVEFEKRPKQEYIVPTDDVQAICSSLSNRSTCSSSELIDLITKLVVAVVENASPSNRPKIRQMLSERVLSIDSSTTPTSSFEKERNKPCIL